MAKRPSSRSKATETAAPAAPKTRRARPAAIPVPVPSVDDIRRRAYGRYLERGGHHGQHFDDWLEAERELKNKK
jgi:hypothetical protein